VDIRKANCFVINGATAPAADGFCGLEVEGETGVRELHQNKQIKDVVDKNYYLKEHTKTAMANDVFIIFTTGNSSITAADLPKRAGIVSKQNFQDYFGPFAARAFFTFSVHINKATRSQLELIGGIGENTAKRILNEREKGDFKDRDDFNTRTGIQKSFREVIIF